MEDMTREEYGKMLKEVVRDVLLVIAIFATMVVYIFQSSAFQWNQHVKAEEATAAARAKAAADKKASLVTVYGWVNEWDLVDEKRSPVELKPGREYTVGALRQYDVNDRDLHKTGFNSVRFIPDDDTYYADPILTLVYPNYIHAQYSIDNTQGWLTYGETARGAKTNTLLYIPTKENNTGKSDGWGNGMMTVRFPINGLNNLEVNATDSTVSKELREYNYFVDERLGDIYDGVPSEFAGRTRRVWTSHLIIEAWAADPRVKGATVSRPATTLRIRVRSYGTWDLTQEEYDSIVHSAPGITEREYTEKTTIELIV